MLTLDANVWVAAYDPHDKLHDASVALLRTLVRRRVDLNGPAIVLLESACALARRTQSATAGQAALNRLRAYPLFTIYPLNESLLSLAMRLGVSQLLRSADALYAATASISSSTLVSWDQELVRRAGAVTPTEWLSTNS